MTITSADIMKLRAQTGAGMMDCKKALEEAGGNLDAAAELLRKKGILKAAKRADKIAAEGLVTGAVSSDKKIGVVLEVNCETDFVAKSDDFIAFSKQIAEAALKHNPADLIGLHQVTLSNGKTVEGFAGDLTIKIGEKVNIRRFTRYETTGQVAVYLHGAKIGVMVDMQGGDAELATDVAMHIAASNPKYLSRNQVDAAEVAKEKEIYAAQLKGKPANIMENILKGKIDKYYGEICLLEQPFIKNEDLTVGKMVEGKKAKIVSFVRYELGEGLEKKSADFAAEVAEQLK